LYILPSILDGGIMAPISIWGPALWKVLHGIGFGTGIASPIMLRDVTREYVWLMNNIEIVIPCVHCVVHVREFKKDHPSPTGLDGGVWLWELHESVNKKLGAVGIPYSPEIGSGTNVDESWKIYKNILSDSLVAGHVSGASVKDYGRRLGLWRGFLCI